MTQITQIKGIAAVLGESRPFRDNARGWEHSGAGMRDVSTAGNRPAAEASRGDAGVTEAGTKIVGGLTVKQRPGLLAVVAAGRGSAAALDVEEFTPFLFSLMAAHSVVTDRVVYLPFLFGDLRLARMPAVASLGDTGGE